MILNKTTDRIANYFLFIGDFAIIVLSFAFSWWLRFRSNYIPIYKDFQPFDIYSIPIVIVTIIWLFAFWQQKLFKIEFSRRWGDEVSRIIRASIIGLVLSMALTFIYRRVTYSRLTLGIGVIITVVLTIVFHRAVIIVLKKLLERGIGVAKKVVIGDGNLALSVVQQILDDPLTAKGLSGRICTEDSEHRIGSPSELKDILIGKKIDVVILAEPNVSESAIRRIIYECRKEKALFVLVPHFNGLLRGVIEIGKIGDLGSIVFRDVAMTGWQRYAKRLLDIVGSFLCIIIASPLLASVAIAIKLNSPGPVFFTQERIGKNGRKFRMIKFRTMFKDAEKRLGELLDKNEAKGAIFKIKDDPRITKIGKFLRRFSIDELPQLFNVFIGQMSLVGPRPPLERELAEYETWQLKRVDTVPGMTGLWQVSGRSNLPFVEMVKLDIEYIEHWSLWLDIKILLKTLPAVLAGKGAY